MLVLLQLLPRLVLIHTGWFLNCSPLKITKKTSESTQNVSLIVPSKKYKKITKYHDNSYNCSSQKVLGGKLKQVYTKKLNQLNSFCWSSMCACSICTVHLSTVKKEKEWQFDTNEKKTTSDARFKKAEEIKHDAIINLKFNVNINLNF